MAQQDLIPKCDFSGKQLTLSVSCAGILYAHVSPPRGEDIIEDELVSVAVDAFDGHDDLPVSAVLRLKVVEFQLALVFLVDATIDRVILKNIYFSLKRYFTHLLSIILPYSKSSIGCLELLVRIFDRKRHFARRTVPSSSRSTAHPFPPEMRNRQSRLRPCESLKCYCH